MTFKGFFDKVRSSRTYEFAFSFTAILICTLSLSWLLNYDPYSLIKKTSDFNSGDYYDRLYHANTVLRTDTNIVIIATDHIPNEAMADVLIKIADYGAVAIGFDLRYRNESSVTDELIDVIDSLPQIVLPVMLVHGDRPGSVKQDTPSLLDEYTDGKFHATVTFPPRTTTSLQRKMYLKVPLEDGDSIESFALTLARMKKPDLKTDIHNTVQAINYNISEVEVITFEEFNDPKRQKGIASLIKGNIVLAGDMFNSKDTHPTAVDENMPGVVVHAAAISTLLSERPVKPLGRVWSIIFTVLCIAAVTLINVYYSENDFLKGLGLIGIKGLFLILILFGGYALYIYCDIRSDFTYSIVLFMFSIVIADFWFGLTKVTILKKNDKNNNDDNDNKNDKSVKIQ